MYRYIRFITLCYQYISNISYLKCIFIYSTIYSDTRTTIISFDIHRYCCFQPYFLLCCSQAINWPVKCSVEIIILKETIYYYCVRARTEKVDSESDQPHIVIIRIVSVRDSTDMQLYTCCRYNIKEGSIVVLVCLWVFVYRVKKKTF